MKSLKKLGAVLMAGLMALSFAGCGEKGNKEPIRLTLDSWADDVKSGINTFLDIYGNKSENYNENSYVVFDFDNTSSIFDVGEQFAVYQIEKMAFGFSPMEIGKILATGLDDLNKQLEYGKIKCTYNDWIADIEKAYAYLYETYGPFSPNGLSAKESELIQKDPEWLEFAAKIRELYNLIGDVESKDVSYPWITYWLTGFTAEEVYSLASYSHSENKEMKSEYITWTSPESVESQMGVISTTFVNGISVTQNIKELWNALNENGIKVWVCSATHLDIIRAAVDVFGLHNSITGVMGMTLKTVKNEIINSYDYETGYCAIANDDGTWLQGEEVTKAQTQGKGKVTAIKNVCMKKYGIGPIAGFMDSTGDFNFCTEFENLKMVVCFNRANRKVSDGGGLIAELALYQRDILGYDLKKANENGDTMYYLQGRDENELRSFRNSNKTLRLDESEEKLFANEENQKQLDFMIENNMTTEEIINTFAMNTINSKANKLGFAYGFLSQYDGYHNVK